MVIKMTKEIFLNEIKNKVYICLDVGSTHNGKLNYALELVERTKEVGADCCKFQLGVTEPNIDLPFEYFIKAFEKGKEIGVDVTASIFNKVKYFNDYLQLKPKFIKFAYSQKHETQWQTQAKVQGIPIVVSCDIMTWDIPIDDSIKLFCLPQYPVYSKIDFEELFGPLTNNENKRFYGFSDHSLGIQQSIKSSMYLSKWIEKHIKLNHSDINCPDSKFAVTFDQVSILNLEINDWNKKN